MQPFGRVSGVVAPMVEPNIDTDVIMPKQFLKGVSRDNLVRGVFYHLRFDCEGQESRRFILNQTFFVLLLFLWWVQTLGAAPAENMPFGVSSSSEFERSSEPHLRASSTRIAFEWTADRPAEPASFLFIVAGDFGTARSRDRQRSRKTMYFRSARTIDRICDR